MNDTNTPDNISETQSPRAMHTIGCFYAGVTHHLFCHRGFYGFVSGIAATLLTLWAILWYGIFAYPLPWKITDPSHPRFDPEKFRFTDYQNRRDLDEALEAMFPAGTPKSIVDDLLIQKGVRATKYNHRIPLEDGLVDMRYSYSNIRCIALGLMTLTSDTDWTWRVSILFDGDMKVKEISAIGP